MGVTETIALSMGAAWASGINLYAAVFVLGFLGSSGQITLPPELQFLSNPLVLWAAGLMYCVEFFTDKWPGVDNLWDAIHTFVRIPAGALLAANGMAEIGPGAELAGLLLGGGVTAATHATKASGRLARTVLQLDRLPWRGCGGICRTVERLESPLALSGTADALPRSRNLVVAAHGLGHSARTPLGTAKVRSRSLKGNHRLESLSIPSRATPSGFGYGRSGSVIQGGCGILCRTVWDAQSGSIG